MLPLRRLLLLRLLRLRLLLPPILFRRTLLFLRTRTGGTEPVLVRHDLNASAFLVLCAIAPAITEQYQVALFGFAVAANTARLIVIATATTLCCIFSLGLCLRGKSAVLSWARRLYAPVLILLSLLSVCLTGARLSTRPLARVTC